LQKRPGTGLPACALGKDLGHVGPVAAASRDDRPSGLGVHAELAIARGLAEQLLGLLDRQLVGRDAFRHVRPHLATLEIGAVAADAQDDVVADRDRVDSAGVDLAQIRDQLLQPVRAVRIDAEVEAPKPLDAFFLA
jgi:hypothetical protein